MTQATAELDGIETATSEQPSETGNGFSEMLASFADDEQARPATTSLEDGAEASAKPDPGDTSTLTDSTGTATPEVAPEVDELTTALQKIATLEANHKKYSDDVNGRVGLMEQVMKAQARTPVGQKVRLTMEDFEDFGKEYSEFAEAQVKAVNKALEKLEMTGLSQEFTSGLIKDAQTAAEAAAERKYLQKRVTDCRDDLSETHKGWEQIIGLPDKDVEDGGIPPDTEFRRWLKTQPDGYGDRVLGSYSAVVLGKALDKFTASKQPPTPKPKQTSTPTPSLRQQRLSAAVTTKTSGTVETPKKEVSGYQAMLESYKQD